MGSSEDHVKEETLEEVDVSSPGRFPISGAGDFSEGETILALHGDRLYDAKILMVEVRDGERRYYVHYVGWNKSWDEWLGIDRVLKHTKENVEKQQALENQDPDEGRKSDCHQRIKKNGSTVLQVKKRKRDSGFKKPDTSAEIIFDIIIPVSLKKQLVADWEHITQQEKLLKLPCYPNVDQILSKYLDYMLKNNGVLTDSTGEILKGLRCYFDRALPVILLYEKERFQFRETVLDNMSPSSIYGAQHLLRLFVKLPELLAQVNIDKKTSIQLHERLNDFIRFLKKNRSSFFTSSYHSSKVSEAARNNNTIADSQEQMS
uniref:Chromo domain-containing protein n=1 Tax=Kalanchoe fedtschenkoi TaxID=63787 RepID=A0A7N0SYL8_KALFE